MNEKQITPLQSRAWEYENQALLAKRDGASVEAHYLLSYAKQDREQELHERIHVIFERLDTQNILLDGIALIKANNHTLPLLEAKV